LRVFWKGIYENTPYWSDYVIKYIFFIKKPFLTIAIRIFFQFYDIVLSNLSLYLYQKMLRKLSIVFVSFEDKDLSVCLFSQRLKHFKVTPIWSIFVEESNSLVTHLKSFISIFVFIFVSLRTKILLFLKTKKNYDNNW
jgi:hypothetical protein